jgi:hypothetical protein
MNPKVNETQKCLNVKKRFETFGICHWDVISIDNHKIYRIYYREKMIHCGQHCGEICVNQQWACDLILGPIPINALLLLQIVFYMLSFMIEFYSNHPFK